MKDLLIYMATVVVVDVCLVRRCRLYKSNKLSVKETKQASWWLWFPGRYYSASLSLCWGKKSSKQPSGIYTSFVPISYQTNQLADIMTGRRRRRRFMEENVAAAAVDAARDTAWSEKTRQQHERKHVVDSTLHDQEDDHHHHLSLLKTNNISTNSLYVAMRTDNFPRKITATPLWSN